MNAKSCVKNLYKILNQVYLISYLSYFIIVFSVTIVVDDPRCLVSMWSAWSLCLNATCHRLGTQIRTRMYADKKAAMIAHCSERLKQQRRCTLDCDNNNLKNDKNKQMTTG